MIKIFNQTIATIALTVISHSLNAEQYLGIQLGQTTDKSFGDVCDDVDYIKSVINIEGSCNNQDIGFRLFYGTAINGNFYLESGYQDFGSSKASLTDGYDYETFSAEASGIDISAVGKFPLSIAAKFVLRGGLLFWDHKISYNSSFDGNSSESDSGNSFFMGFGLEFSDIIFSYDKINDVGDKDTTGETDLTRLSVGYKFKF